MFDWIIQNIGTVTVGLILAGILAAITVKIVRDKRKGKCVGCDGGCTKSASCSRDTDRVLW